MCTWPIAGLWFSSWPKTMQCGLVCVAFASDFGLFCIQETMFRSSFSYLFNGRSVTCGLLKVTFQIWGFIDFFSPLIGVKLSQSNSYSLLGFTSAFLTHTASSVCQCRVTMVINRPVLAAVKMQNCAVEARGSQHRLGGFCCAFPPSRSLNSDIVLPMRTKNSGLTLCYAC